MLRRYLRDDAIAGKRRLAMEPLLEADRQIGIQQAADANDNNGAMRKNITPLVGGSLLGGDQGRMVFIDYFDLVAIRRDLARQLLCECRARRSGGPLGLVMEIAQRLFAHILA